MIRTKTDACRPVGRATSRRLAKRKEKGLQQSQALEYLARPAGFEPTTPWFVAKYSIQLSYGRKGAEFITARGYVSRWTEAFSAAASAASPPTMSSHFRSMPLRCPFCVSFNPCRPKRQRKRLVLDHYLALQFFAQCGCHLCPL